MAQISPRNSKKLLFTHWKSSYFNYVECRRYFFMSMEYSITRDQNRNNDKPLTYF